MQVDELLPYLRANQETLIQEIRNGKYKPNPVRRVEIPKETKGEFRKLVQKFLNKWTIFLFCSILFSSNQKEH